MESRSSSDRVSEVDSSRRVLGIPAYFISLAYFPKPIIDGISIFPHSLSSERQ